MHSFILETENNAGKDKKSLSALILFVILKKATCLESEVLVCA